jgi:hypothetical protein
MRIPVLLLLALTTLHPPAVGEESSVAKMRKDIAALKAEVVSLKTELAALRAAKSAAGMITPGRAMGNIAPYKKQLLQKLARNWKPSQSKSGLVMLIMIGRTGELVNYTVQQSSGDAAIDEQARKLIQTSSYDPLPAWYAGDRLEFKIAFDQLEQMQNSYEPQKKSTSAVKKVLDWSQFSGSAALVYAQAAKYPQLLEQLFCYSGDDVTNGHTCLLDCYTSEHAVYEHLCQEELLFAVELYRKGTSIGRIQQLYDEKYSRYYPFQDESNALKDYRAKRNRSREGFHKLTGRPSIGMNGNNLSRASAASKNNNHYQIGFVQPKLAESFAERDFEAKKRIFAIKYPWQMIIPYGDHAPPSLWMQGQQSVGPVSQPAIRAPIIAKPVELKWRPKPGFFKPLSQITPPKLFCSEKYLLERKMHSERTLEDFRRFIEDDRLDPAAKKASILRSIFWPFPDSEEAYLLVAKAGITKKDIDNKVGKFPEWNRSNLMQTLVNGIVYEYTNADESVTHWTQTETVRHYFDSMDSNKITLEDVERVLKTRLDHPP